MEFTAVIYMRYSSKMQNETSIEGQRRVVRNYAKRQNITVIGEYADRAKSGKTDKRTEFISMIDAIESGKLNVNFVLVYKLDRFARNENLHREYERRLNEHGASLISATEDVNADNLANRIMKSVSIAINEEEVRKISQNVSRGKKEVAYKCQWCGGNPPLGYDVDPQTKKLILNESEAKIVSYAFSLRAQGFSYSYIIERLNKRKYKTKLGNSFGKNSLHDLYKNIKYKGIYEYNRAAAKSDKGTFNRHAEKDESEIIRIKDGCPRIVSDEVWDTVNKMSRKNSSIKPKGDYLLSGLVKCKCGTVMQVNKRTNHNKVYISFFCPKHKNKEGCNAKEINMEQVEDFVLLNLADIIFTKASAEKFIDNFPFLNAKKISQFKRKIKEFKGVVLQNNKRIKNCISNIENGCDKTVTEQMNARIKELSEENSKLEHKIEMYSKISADTPSVDEILKLKEKFIGYVKKESNLPLIKKYLQELVGDITVTDSEIKAVFSL